MIEWLSGYARVGSTPPASFQGLVEATLRNPERIWRHAFDRQVSEGARSVLLSLFGLSGSATVVRLKEVFDALHQHRADRYRLALAANEFHEALRELDGAFIRIDAGTIRFINPSVKDFLAGLTAEVPDHALDLLASASGTEQVARVWQVAGTDAGAGLRSVILARPSLILDPLRRALAIQRAERVQDGRGLRILTYDARWEARAALALSVAETLRTEDAWGLLEQALSALPAAWRDESPDWSDVQDLLRALENASWDRVREATDLYDRLKSAFIPEFCYADASDFVSVIEHADLSSRWTEADWAALHDAFSEYLSSSFESAHSNRSSSEELTCMRDDLDAAGDRLGISVWRQTRMLDALIAEQSAEEERAATSEEGPVGGRGMRDFDDVRQVRRMFDTLRAD